MVAEWLQKAALSDDGEIPDQLVLHLLSALSNMQIDVLGRARIAVAEAVLDDFQRYALLSEQARHGVAQDVRSAVPT